MKSITFPLPDLSRAAQTAQLLSQGIVITADPAALRARQELQQLRAKLRALEAAEAARQEVATRRAHRLHFLESRTLHIRDNTRTWRCPAVVATTDAVFLRLPLNPRTAIPLALPWLSTLRRWFLRR